MDLLDYAHEKEASHGDIAEDRVFNERLYSTIMEAKDGTEGLSKVAAASEMRILRRLRERSIVRRLLEFKPTSEAELVSLPNEEMPVIIGEMQQESRGAVSLSMKDTADQETFWRETYIVRFFVVSTPEYYKNTFELKGHIEDTVKYLTEDMLLDLEEEEDRRWFSASDDIVGAIDSPAGASGYPQHFYFGEFSRETHVDAQYLFDDRRMPKGVFVVNNRFMSNFQKLPRDLIGGDLSQEAFLKGGEAFKEGIIGGVPHLFTSKNDLVPDNVMYQYTAKNYLGVAREFQKPTMFMEKKKRMLFFSMEEVIAIHIANVAGVFKGVFENKPS